MDETTEGVKTVIGPDLYGYIEKAKLEQFLKDLFRKEIVVYVGFVSNLYLYPSKNEYIILLPGL